MNTRKIIVASLVVGSCSALACGQAEIRRSVFMDAGGLALSPTLEITATLGQPIAGVAAGATMTISAGFWFELTPPPPTCPVDFNNDGILEPGDLDDFITMFFSPAPDNQSADFNGDGIVEPGDLDDFITRFFEGC